VFLKAPRPGAAKTRLVGALGEVAAASLYRLVAEAVLEATVPEEAEYERLVFFDPPDAAAAVRAWLPGLRLLPQAEGDLGARMRDAFARAFRRGARRAALVGTDVLGVSRQTVVSALDALDEADVVLGPAQDGGYYLIALRAEQPALFDGIAWSTRTVLATTLARARDGGLSIRQLGPMGDLDTVDDLRAEWPRLEAVLARDPALVRTVAAGIGVQPAPPGVPLPGREGAMPEIKTYLEALMELDEAPLRVEAGKVIFAAGDPGREMFIVRTGSVELRIGETALETVGQGGIFGELALVDPAPRSASAVAGPDCTLVMVDETTFVDLVRRVPGLALEVMKVMARRLRRTNPVA
jgi:rSAM/selenodomain-associated transferase 1